MYIHIIEKYSAIHNEIHFFISTYYNKILYITYYNKIFFLWMKLSVKFMIFTALNNFSLTIMQIKLIEKKNM